MQIVDTFGLYAVYEYAIFNSMKGHWHKADALITLHHLIIAAAAE